MNALFDEIIGFYEFMRTFIVLDNTVFSIVLKACSESRNFSEGRKLHGYIIKVGIPDSFVLIGLVDMYTKCRDTETARKVFDRILNRNVVCWTSIIAGYVQNDCAQEGTIREASLIFNELSIIDLVSWTVMIIGYALSGYAEDALLLFTDKTWQGVMLNSVTLASILSACAQSPNLKLGASVHSQAIKLGLDDANVTNALVDMYAKHRRIGDANYLVENFSDKNVIAQNSIISGYSQNGSVYEALK
ncbi:pentatricopeptide repeat-containing protein At2g03380, mitochondrial-like, partial [Olea europaea var. sylvestris]|uniref:pentatricopeptide repeat-containing protein At2g03380, mitochondrial-like n=1 Tax=Olea europaea var. sylvestris TaxID=158386 RepID=UPI000C1D2C1B